VDENKIYIRSEAETGLAVRDEIVDLVRRGISQSPREMEAEPAPTPIQHQPAVHPASPTHEHELETPPKTGVEVVSMDERNGVHYYTVRDLRNGNVVKNVTRQSARRLWHYAISSYASLPDDLSQAGIQWQGNLGLLSQHKQGKIVRYDLVQSTGEGTRYYFGVTEDGIHGGWKQLVGQEDE
jgi:hypothetical protein